MSELLFLILRRLRAPLITLIIVYAISVGGLALIPGMTPDGNREPMSIFHAFYVMTYTATTIGFGEIPYPFTDAQRLWVHVRDLPVGDRLGVHAGLGHRARQRPAVSRRGPARHLQLAVRGLAEPFYVLCGYGQSGSRLARALDRLGNRLVIVDPSTARMAPIAVQDYATPPLTLAADARLADVLEDSGVRSPFCLGVIALAGEDAVNQAIAIGARVLNPGILIVARAKSDVAKVNLESFGGVAVINPFETFAYNVGVGLRSPEIVQLEDWLTATYGSPVPPADPAAARAAGCWWASAASAARSRRCSTRKASNGRRSIRARSPTPISVSCTATTPRASCTMPASSMPTCWWRASDSDAVNLGATTLARRVKPDIFVVIRQNQMQDRSLVEAARANLKFVQSEIMVNECLQVLKTPMLGRFIAQLRAGDSAQAATVLARVRQVVGEGSPHVWTFDCDVLQPGMFYAFFQRVGMPFRIQHLLADPTNPGERMRATPLMLERDRETRMLPADDTILKPGDRILFAGDDVARRLQQRYLTEPGTVAWVCSGSEPPRGFIFRWLSRRRARAAA